MRRLLESLPDAYRCKRVSAECREGEKRAVHPVRTLRQRLQTERAESEREKGGMII